MENKATKLVNDKQIVEEYLTILPNHQYRGNKEPDIKVFSESDVQTLDLIIKHFNSFSALELSEFSHQFPEWRFYEKALGIDKMPMAARDGLIATIKSFAEQQ